MRPCTWTQTDEVVTVKLLVAAGTSGRQVDFVLDANSLSISVGGEPSSVVGRLAGLVKPTDSTWELERAPPAEAQPRAEDLIVVTLVKSRPGEWPALFQGGGRSMARKGDELPNAPPPRLAPSEALKERPNREPPVAPIATRQPVPLSPGGGASGAGDASSPMAFVPRKLQLGGTTQQRRPAAAQPTGGGGSGVANDANTPAISAREHWVGESATLWA